MSEEIDTRRVLLLAVAITEWSGALEHLAALDQIGIGYRDGRASGRAKAMIRRELTGWMEQWPRVTSPTLSDDQIKSEAREYLTKHQRELEELLAQQEE